MSLSLLTSRFHVGSTPQASGVTIPIPVMTTRFIGRLRGECSRPYAPRHRAQLAPVRNKAFRSRGCSRSAFRVFLKKFDRIAYGQNGLGGVIGDFAAELFLKGHHK